MTPRPRRHPDRKPDPPGSSRPGPDPVSPDGDVAAADHLGQGTSGGRLAYSVDEAALLTGLSRDLLYDEMRRGNLTYVKVGRRRLITRHHLQQFLGIAT